eukprot:16428680-Heterocapsa_arctica.AAC.1
MGPPARLHRVGVLVWCRHIPDSRSKVRHLAIVPWVAVVVESPLLHQMIRPMMIAVPRRPRQAAVT